MIIAGPCAIESMGQFAECAAFLSSRGITYLRAGAFKPRTRPSDFQGLGAVGLDIAREYADKFSLRLVTELLDTRDVEKFSDRIDVIQIGARNMQNYELLKAVAQKGKPVLLKRGLASTVEEWFAAAAYLDGCDVWLCERGHRTFCRHVRFMLDVAAIAVAKQAGWTVVADPSHPAGRSGLVLPLARAALSAGADGLIVEVHPNPHSALSDSEQQLSFAQFDDLLTGIGEYEAAL